MEKKPHLLHFAIGKAPGYETFLVRAARAGSGPLDLKLAGTEGENAYILDLRDIEVDSYRTKPYRLDNEQWRVVVEHILTRRQPAAPHSALLDGLEVAASLQLEKEAVINVRRSVEGITQRFGSLPFAYSPNEDIQLFDWAAEASLALSATSSAVADLKTENTRQAELITSLNAQLEDFIQLKKEHEDSLLVKFQALLNSKKLKIRDQQRLLAKATFNIDQDDPAQPSLSSQSRTPGASAAHKRKASVKSESEDSDSFAPPTRINTNENTLATDDEDDGHPASTPEADQDQDETTDEEQEEHEQVSAAASQSTTQGIKPPKRTQRVSPPPKRPLPFAKNTTAPATAASTSDAQGKNDDDEGETDDDEL